MAHQGALFQIRLSSSHRAYGSTRKRGRARVQRRMAGVGVEGLAPTLRHLPSRLCSDLWLGLVPMPLVLESEGPRLEGVEGEISELGGEEKPSWGEAPMVSHRPLGKLAKERGHRDHHSGPLLLGYGTLATHEALLWDAVIDAGRSYGQHGGEVNLRPWGQQVAAARPQHL